MFDRATETLPRERLTDLQVERLRVVARHVVARVPFYRERFAEAAVEPDDIRSLDDLARLPFTSKSDLRDHYPFGLFAVPRTEVLRLHASSGTRGKPTVVGYTRADIDLWAQCCARSLACAGARPGDMVHNAYGYGLFTGGLGLHYGAERLGATVVPASGGNTPRQVLLLQDFRARVLCCTPSYALNIAGVAEQNGVDPRSLALQIGVFGAEPWTEAMRSRIEQTFGLAALDIYGLSEVLGPGVAMECAEGRDGLHIWEDHFLPEIVDPATGQPRPDGTPGELVLTTLTKEAMPVIRYRTGDITVLHAAECPCGRTHRRMARLSGRADDMLIVRGVNVFPSEIERVLLAIADLAPHYRIIVERAQALDTLAVEVELAPGAETAVAALRDQVWRALDAALGLSTQVTLCPPGTLPRSEGKAQRVLDRRDR
ncbi:MAG TPA: phenylacetate--CoA ligase [Chloroflexota bacterium]|nr:phenylacetate--CoA ligase [Chloroflexota bacterium]